MVSGKRIQVAAISPLPVQGFEYIDEDFPPLPPPAPVIALVLPVAAQVPVAEDNAHQMASKICVTVKHEITEPRSIKEALNHPGWNGSMGEEIGICHETNTWSLLPRPADTHVIGCRWVHKIKLKADGTMEKLRSRLVAKGNEQEEGIDFLETYSHVVRTATARMVLHTATVNHWDIRQLDIKNAFLHDDLNETVYMRQPPGFVDPQYPDHVCLLHNDIYDLKQAPRAWFDKFSAFLIAFGFKCSIKDPSLFIYHHGSTTIFLLLYVDDMVLTGNDSATLKKLLESLSSEFRMKDMGQLSYFLGIQVQYTPTGLFLNQEKYACDLLHTARMLDCSPMPTHVPLQINRVPHQEEYFSDPTYFRSLAGKLQYLTLTRPDLQFAVNLVCQRMHKPTMADFLMLKIVLRYIKGTATMGLHFYSDSTSSLQAFCDSD